MNLKEREFKELLEVGYQAQAFNRDSEKCPCGCHYSDFAYRGGKDCAMCGDNHND